MSEESKKAEAAIELVKMLQKRAKEVQNFTADQARQRHKKSLSTNWKLNRILDEIKRASGTERSIEVDASDWYDGCRADLEEMGYKVARHSEFKVPDFWDSFLFDDEMKVIVTYTVSW